jgi:HSP20 family protein
MLTPWNDFDRAFFSVDELRRQMDRAFRDFDSAWDDGPRLPHDQATHGGPFRLLDAGENLVLTVDVPGLGQKDIAVTLEDGRLSIRGDRKIEPPQGYVALRQERAPYKFARTFVLPCKVDPERTTAIAKDGVLTVTLPKAREAQPRTITVRAS